MRFATQALAAAAVVGVAAASTSAFTAANTTTPIVSVGQASTATGGYAVSLVDYTLSSGASGAAVSITTVVFRLTPSDATAEPAIEARVRLVSTGDYTTCGAATTATLAAASGNARDFSCTISGVTAAAANTLDIVGTSI